jgi:hypothetical protein
MLINTLELMEPGLIPVLHYVAEAKAPVESYGVETKDDHDGIFQIQDRLEEEVDPLTSSSYLHLQLEVKVTQETYGCEFCTKSFSTKKSANTCFTVVKNPTAASIVYSRLPSYLVCRIIYKFTLERNLFAASSVQSFLARSPPAASIVQSR